MKCIACKLCCCAAPCCACGEDSAVLLSVHTVLLPAVPLQLGGSVAVLEDQAATLFGKEAAIWMPTGTMANLLGVYACARETRCSRVVLPADSHVYNDTGDGLSRLLSLQPAPLAAGRPCFTAAEVAAAIKAGETGGRVRVCQTCMHAALRGFF